MLIDFSFYGGFWSLHFEMALFGSRQLINEEIFRDIRLSKNLSNR